MPISTKIVFKKAAAVFPATKKPRFQAGLFCKFSPGDDLLSHDLNTAVSSAMKGLTSGFGMEPGVPPSLWTPTNSNPLRICSRREAIRGSLEILKGCFRVPVPGQRLLFRQGGFLKHSLAIVGRKGR